MNIKEFQVYQRRMLYYIKKIEIAPEDKRQELIELFKESVEIEMRKEDIEEVENKVNKK